MKRDWYPCCCLCGKPHRVMHARDGVRGVSFCNACWTLNWDDCDGILAWVATGHWPIGRPLPADLADLGLG